MALIRFQPIPAKDPLNPFWNLSFNGTLQTQPMVNILETTDGFRIDLAAPGLDKEDFQLQIEKDLLIIVAGKAPETTEEGVRVHRREFAYGAFERTFRLPADIDLEKVGAVFTDGILQINLVRKAEIQPAVKTIQVA